MARRKAQQTNGSVAADSTVKAVTTSASTISTTHQTHGAYTPLSGPITNVSQLTNGGKNVAQGSIGSFETMAEYTAYLKTLSLAQLHRHAVEEAKIVPIDDRDRLIRRLETQWTSTASRYPGRAGSAIPSRQPFTAEQIAKQEALRNKLLNR